MRSKRNILFTGLLSLFMMVSQLGIIQVFAESISPRAVGDDPGVLINSPDQINSNQNVEIDVSLQGSAGNLNENGIIQVTIPQNTVGNPTDLSNLANYSIDDPFSFGDPMVTQDSRGNYLVNLKYDASKINQNDAFAATVKIHFESPLNYQDNSTVTFSANMAQGSITSSDLDTSVLVPHETHNNIFTKWSPNKRQTVDGISSAIMDTDDPAKNIFAVTVNYKHESLTNAVVSDTLPEGTSLVNSRPYQDATGNSSIIKHLRILKVTSWNEDDSAATWHYVTQDFADKIVLTENGFSVDFGNLSPEDSYEIVYGLSVDEPFTSFKTNDANLSSVEYRRNAVENISLANDEYENYTLAKKVSQETLATTEGTLSYSLDLQAKAGSLPSGTIVTDPLANDFSGADDFNYDPSMVSKPVYDGASRTITYQLLKELKVGEHTLVTFNAKLKNGDANLAPGYIISNRASFNFSGTEIYSNTATTTLDSSLQLKKVDADTGSALPGAMFVFKDSKGNIVATEVTNNEGLITLGLLDPGNYTATEVKAPDNYIIDSKEIPFTVTDGMTNTLTLNQLNDKVDGKVVLTKVDEQDGSALPGAKFELEDNTGNIIQPELTTDKSGKIEVKQLAPGNYQFVETQAPDGYLIDQTPVEFVIKKGQSEAVQVMKSNKSITGNVVLTKVDEQDGSALPGAKFELEDNTGNIIQPELTTDKSGKIEVKQLAPGNYQFVETQAPDGYLIDQTPVEFVIKKGQSEAVQVMKKNKKITGSLILPNIPFKNATTQNYSFPKTGEKISITYKIAGIILITLVFIGSILYFVNKIRTSK
ncbi:collagen binding domain-containing protein [Enterococcus faecium]|uniref:MSCRAMM family protein n=1 Tax=Enterococcus faecium TaxID=1352 RepID=UPI000BEF88ED|nr:SpaA isopeptide-forming pilin-related protein [Enterococcus faecium]PEH49541.1 hypothetical protein CRM75_01940 [Enterococcus faecium]